MIDQVQTWLGAHGVEAVGWLAAGTVFLTFCMRTMQTLRWLAVISNLAFAAYALAADLMPVLVLHGALLPLNLVRLAQMRRQVRLAEEVALVGPEAETFLWLAQFGRTRRLVAGETLFDRGDRADSLFVVTGGEVEAVEVAARLGPGALVGEVGLFSPERRRTGTVVARGAAELSELTSERVQRLWFDNPRFAWRLLRLVTARLVGNMERSRAESDALGRVLSAAAASGAAGPPGPERARDTAEPVGDGGH